MVHLALPLSVFYQFMTFQQNLVTKVSSLIEKKHAREINQKFNEKQLQTMHITLPVNVSYM